MPFIPSRRGSTTQTKPQSRESIGTTLFSHSEDMSTLDEFVCRLHDRFVPSHNHDVYAKCRRRKIDRTRITSTGGVFEDRCWRNGVLAATTASLSCSSCKEPLTRHGTPPEGQESYHGTANRAEVDFFLVPPMNRREGGCRLHTCVPCFSCLLFLPSMKDM